MANEAAQLLDQLMGSARNALPGEKVKQLHWWDDKVCKHFLCGFCPSELFVNTKAEASVGKCGGAFSWWGVFDRGKVSAELRRQSLTMFFYNFYCKPFFSSIV